MTKIHLGRFNVVLRPQSESEFHLAYWEILADWPEQIPLPAWMQLETKARTVGEALDNLRLALTDGRH